MRTSFFILCQAATQTSAVLYSLFSCDFFSFFAADFGTGAYDIAALHCSVAFHRSDSHLLAVLAAKGAGVFSLRSCTIPASHTLEGI